MEVGVEVPYQPMLDIGKVLRILSYLPTPTKLTNAISKTQLSGPKKGGFSPKPPKCAPFSVFGVFLAVLSPLSEIYILFLCH